MAYNPQNPNGQAAMAASTPVVIASNQSNVWTLINGKTFFYLVFSIIQYSWNIFEKNIIKNCKNK